jgi:hypothetical protein
MFECFESLASAGNRTRPPPALSTRWAAPTLGSIIRLYTRDRLCAELYAPRNTNSPHFEVSVELPLNPPYHISIQCLNLLNKTSNEGTIQVCVKLPADSTCPR